MNRSKIEWCDYTWNPITGCRYNCNNCYAKPLTERFSGNVRLNLMAKDDYLIKKAANGEGVIYELDQPMYNETGVQLVYAFGFEPTYYRYRLKTLSQIRMGSNILVCSLSDLFGEWIPDRWIEEVINECKKYPHHNYLFLTKNPKRYKKYGNIENSKNMWFGTTVAKISDMSRINYLPMHCKKFVAFEPLLEDIQIEKNIQIIGNADWVVIGAETGNKKKVVVPQKEWIQSIVKECESLNIPVFMRDSLATIVDKMDMKQEYPEELTVKKMSREMKNRLYGECCSCKERMEKRKMVVILARSQKGEYPMQFGFMCDDCFKKFCKDSGLDIPELARWNRDRQE